MNEITKLKLYNALKKAWSKDTCFPSCQNEWTNSNPSLGQCAITALIVNDIYGGRIMRCIVDGVSHYYNEINDVIIDFTVEQFNGILPDYKNSIERTRDYILSNNDTMKRYQVLLQSLYKVLDNQKNIKNLDFNVFENKKNIIFDLDGTLIDSLGMWNQLDYDLLLMFGKQPRNIGAEASKFFSENTAGNIYLRYIQYFIDSYGIKDINAEELLKLRDNLARSYQSKLIELKASVGDFIRTARELKYNLLLATNTSRWIIDTYNDKNENIRRQINLYKMFNKGIITQDDVYHKKPHPEIYLKAIELCGGLPQESIVIEDSIMGIEAAQHANLETIAIYDRHADDSRDKINILTDYICLDYKVLRKNLIS